MSTFIKLTLSNGKIKVVNTSHIVEINPINSESVEFVLINGASYSTGVSLEAFSKLLKHA